MELCFVKRGKSCFKTIVSMMLMFGKALQKQVFFASSYAKNKQKIWVNSFCLRIVM